MWGEEEEIPSPERYIDAAFGQGGYLARRWGVSYQPRESQVALARAVDAALSERSHLLSEAPTGCHAEGQPILMYDGSIKLVEDVVVGDQLMGPDSEPRRVLALARGTERMFDVVPVKGEPWRVNEGHILTLVRTCIVKPGQRRDARGGRIMDVSLAEWRGWSKTQKHLHKLLRVGVNFPSIGDPSLDPYVLGLFLGDGALSSGRTAPNLVMADREVLADLERVAAALDLRVREELDRGCPRFTLTQGPGVGRTRNAFTSKLRSLGVYPIRCEHRFVPGAYKTGSRIVRLQLLAGLIDSDGSLSCGGYDFISKSRKLTEDVVFVARSLGLAATLTERECSGFGVTGTYFRTHISGDVGAIPCRIGRKRAAPRRQIKSVLRTGFSVVPTGTVEPYFGFTLDRDGRFLLGDFTVTHNTGKSLAYSVPATYHAATQGKVVVIVTANIALQEQLVRHDLPLLSEVLPWAFSFGLMKGRSNYLCRSQFEQVRLDSRQQPMFEDHGGSPDERDKRRLFQWAEREVAANGYGDVSSLDWKPPEKLWRDFSVGPEDCRGKRCAFAESCGALAAQRVARQSQVVVTNYHIFFVNLVLCMEKGRDIVLPPFDAVVFDEAHKAADIARDFFGWKISEGSVRRAARYFRSADPAFADSVTRSGSWFFEQMLHLRRDRDRYKARVVPERLSPADVEAGDRLLGSLGELSDRLAAEVGSLVAPASTSRQARDQLGAAEKAHERVGKLVAAVRTIMRNDDDNAVVFVEEDEFRKAHVACRLVRPSAVLRTALFMKTVCHADEDDLGLEDPEPEPVSVVCTSATLATDGDFDFTETELGVPPRTTGLIVESPFDFERQALLIIPEVCDPNDERFTGEVSAAFLRTVGLARGRTLGLFTSRKRMREVYDAVRGRTPFRILCQDDGQRTQLIEEFKRDTHSVLLGVASFWAGVDVPGESLSCVFIDKLPFPTPDDPVLDRLSENDKRAWRSYAVPRAIIEFKQGFGRLIRSSTDRGVVVCCDNRLLTKGYGKEFLRAVPRGVQKIRNLEAIREWLDGPETQAREIDPLS